MSWLLTDGDTSWLLTVTDEDDHLLGAPDRHVFLGLYVHQHLVQDQPDRRAATYTHVYQYDSGNSVTRT